MPAVSSISPVRPSSGPRGPRRLRAVAIIVFQLLLVAMAPPSSVAQPVPRPSGSAEANRGRRLAETYCVACHLVPDPVQLTKTAWAHHIQPEMAKWLGVERVDYEGLADGKLLEEAKIFPPSPILSEDDWFAIWDYYRNAAPSEAPPQPARARVTFSGSPFTPHVFQPASGVPMIGVTRIDPLHHELLVGDALSSVMFVFNPKGDVVRKGRFSSGPVGLSPDDRRTLVTLIGRIFPSDALEGSIVTLPSGESRGAPRVLLDKLRRPTDTVAADLNRDGLEDLVVCQFGNRLGRFSWFEKRRDGGYTEHVLLDRAGALQSRAIDFNRDGAPDLLVLMSQAREGLYLFLNDGQGRFEMQTLIEKQPSWGFTGFDLADFNRDGHVDLVVVNGDNGDLPLPLKNYHGVRLYQNDGSNHLTETWFFPLHGAYKALARDFDGDGDLDIASIAYYPDYSQDPPESFVYLENQGGLRFKPLSLPEAHLGRWMTMDAGDLDGDGDEDLVLGSFAKGPTTRPIPQGTRDLWQTNGAPVLYLENQSRKAR